jgi:hypothetical protein
MPGEVTIKDARFFPITYIDGLASTNGKLTVTNLRLLFKAGKLQPVGGMYVVGIFIPNTGDAKKSEQHVSILLTEITGLATDGHR